MFFFLSVGFITDSPFEVIRFSFLEKYNNTIFFLQICLLCRERGHSLKNCPEKSEGNLKKFCYNCGESGHSLSKCPKPIENGNPCASIVGISGTLCLLAVLSLLAYVVSICRGNEFCKLLYLQTARTFEQELPWKQTWHLSKGTLRYSPMPSQFSWYCECKALLPLCGNSLLETNMTCAHA